MEAALQTFIDEATELLTEMEAALLDCERNDWSADAVNSVFRAAHTIKGSAGLFGLDPIVSFVHVVETALDRVRTGQTVTSEALAVVLMKCTDHIKVLLTHVIEGSESSSAVIAQGADLLERLQSLAGHVGAVTLKQPNLPVSVVADASMAGVTAASDCWHISVRFKADVLRNGMDPLSFIRYLTSFGSLLGSTLIENSLPSAEELDPESCYIGFELRYASDAPYERIEGAFEFVREDCLLAIVPPHAPLHAYLDALDVTAEGTPGYDLLVRIGSLTADELVLALQMRASDNLTDRLLQGDAPDGGDIPAARRDARESAASENRTVRVDSRKLDNLITLLGELIITAAGADVGARRSGDIDLQETTSRLTGLVAEVRDRALQLRMVKIGATFNRFHRVVNDVARETGKQIRLVIAGEDTELDKTLVEKIADPLTHLVRNAIDHGIGAPDIRVSRGKSPMGTVKLNAFHDSGSVVIEVSDDGSGLKREKIFAKAIERGLIDPDKVLTDSEVYALIFEPGFSTAEKVTNLSGRGVGMDVVKSNIEALRGSVNIRSIPGAGTTVTIRLPLTLAIINGFQVRVGASVFVVPLEMVEECIEYCAVSGNDYANVRGEALPFLRLHEVFAMKGAPVQRQSIVIVKHAGTRAGLVVDALLGECQTVIKPLSKMFAQVACVSGSSILGNGEVALILDVPSLLQQALDQSFSHRAASANAA